MEPDVEVERLVATGMQRSEAIARAVLGMVEAAAEPIAEPEPEKAEPETPWTRACCDRSPRCDCSAGLLGFLAGHNATSTSRPRPTGQDHPGWAALRQRRSTADPK